MSKSRQYVVERARGLRGWIVVDTLASPDGKVEKHFGRPFAKIRAKVYCWYRMYYRGDNT